MAVKKMSWRRSNQALSIFCLLSSTFLFSMESGSSSQVDPNGLLSGSSIKEMDEVWEDAPSDVKRFARVMRNPNLMGSLAPHMLVLEGPPGTGKSTLAKAIAYKTDTLLDYVELGELQGESRNQTGKNLYNRLQQTLEWVTKYNKRTLMVVDELNKIMENSEDKHHDTGFTSTILWNFLDSVRKKPLYFVATMNQTHKLPQPMKSRISFDTVSILAPLTDEKRIKMLQNKLTADVGYIALHESCTPDFLKEMAQATKGFTGRDFEGLAREAVGTALDACEDDPKELLIKPEHIKKALAKGLKNRQRSKYYKREETDDEQRERHFMQGQLATFKMQEKQKGQTSIGLPGLLSRTTNGGMNREDIKAVMKECFTPEQLDLLKEHLGRDTVLKHNIRESIGWSEEL